MNFADPWYLALALLAVPVLLFFVRRRKTLSHSKVDMHPNIRASSMILIINYALFAVFWISACAALARPTLPVASEREVMQTRDFVIQTDISGSMGSAVPGQPTPPPGGRRIRIIDLAQEAVIEFISYRQGDQVALLAFSGRGYYSWPLSSDLDVVMRRAQRLSLYTSGGTDFDSENGAFQTAIDHFADLSTARTRVLILVTDGEDKIDDQRFASIVEQLQAMDIKLYILGVGPGWVNESAATSDLRDLVGAVEGTVIAVGNANEMQAAFAEIDQLELSEVEIERTQSSLEIYPYVLMLSVFCVLAFLCLSAIVREET